MLRARRTVAAVGLAMALSSLGFAGTTVAASADTGTCAITPASVTLRNKAVGVKFDVPGDTNWQISIADLNLYPYDRFGTSAATELIDPKIYFNADAGSHDAQVTGDNNDCITSFRLLRASSLSLKVTRKYPYRYLTGTLVRANFGEKGGNSPVKNAVLALQYQSKSGAWVTYTHATTAADGTYGRKLKIGAHTWRAVYSGMSTTAGRTSASHAG